MASRLRELPAVPATAAGAAGSSAAGSSGTAGSSSSSANATCAAAGRHKEAGNAACKWRQYTAAAEQYTAGVEALQEAGSGPQRQQLLLDLSNNLAMTLIKHAEMHPAGEV